ncbi:BadF/BadG/BcrA/BcrD ATPase family protein [Chthonobacter albigriseus]|uniref:BadF/BadG/BcrA/BcrD ATPase family protein n=1 Tax=Chthonobacter albigriseus TaxID=1683161 RepID=UPI0015EF2D2E|nr:BadF/BadG/BcrA/BcrD ATPase family protein [Chthonobacter albigriseus]
MADRAHTLHLGIDGGGTGCRARLTDADGRVLGEATGGPANVNTDFAGAISSILDVAAAAFAAADLRPGEMARARAGFGLAGANAARAAERLPAHPFPFASVAVASDAETACLGAHRGEDGGILILGTGSQGVARVDGRVRTVGGWGFLVSDTASGATLGRAAVRRALLGHEAIEPPSPFTEAVMARFDANPSAMLAWALTAIPRDYAVFAPLVFEAASSGDPVAAEIVREAAADAGRLLDRLVAHGATRIALMGGLSGPYRPWLDSRFDPVLVAPRGDALDGALALSGLGGPA